MNGFFKVALLTAPVLAVVIYLSFFKVQEHSVQMDKENARFERDWNEAQAGFSKNKEDKAKFEGRAKAAQGEYDQADTALKAAKAKTEKIGKDLDKAVDESGGDAHQLKESISKKLEEHK